MWVRLQVQVGVRVRLGVRGEELVGTLGSRFVQALENIFERKNELQTHRVVPPVMYLLTYHCLTIMRSANNL